MHVSSVLSVSPWVSYLLITAVVVVVIFIVTVI
jgi:hypothetical protein